MSRVKSILCVSLFLVAASACAKKSEPDKGQEAAATAAATPPPAPPAEDPAREAKNLFKTRCVVCHGEEGKGDGPGAAALNPKPRDYTDPAWQSSVTDEQIHKAIIFGGAAVGKSPNMPGNPDLESKPAVVDELVKRVRSFKR
ncbi:MAG: c-type cytochrome [Myxococcota bacterium]